MKQFNGGTASTQINGDFLTIITNKHLTPGYKVAQSVHAMASFALEHESEFKDWQTCSNYVCCLETSLIKLRHIISLLDILKIKYSIFLEPDIGNELTSIAVQAIPEKDHKKLFKNLKLTLS